MSKPIPIPTIGRIVLFRAPDGRDRPAIITKVHGQFCINLEVFNAERGDPHSGIYEQVTHIGPETGETPTTGPSWCWMPHQLAVVAEAHGQKEDPAEELVRAKARLINAQAAILEKDLA